MNLIDLNIICEDFDDYIIIFYIYKNIKVLSGSIYMCESNYGMKLVKFVYEMYIVEIIWGNRNW